MQIQQRSPTDLIPYEFNNRVHDETQVNRIANSIQQFGFTQPIVVDEQNVILVGHGRWMAAQRLGLSEVPVYQVRDLSEIQKRAYRILDNKLQNDSTWQFNNLELELGFLEDEGFDLPEWGLDDLRGLFDPEEPEVTEDGGGGEPSAEPFIKRGDLIELGKHRLLCGDSTSEEDVSTLLDGKSPVLMVTDPPYGVEYDPEWREEALPAGHGGRNIGKVANDERIDWGEAYRLFDARVAYVWHAGRHASAVQGSLQDSGFDIIAQIIWVKSHFAIGRGDYHWQHEPCWYAVRTGKTHNWQGSRSESTVWQMERGCGENTGHSTEKPVEAMARPVRNNTRAGELVCDPFLGSGTTLIACEQLGRICYGMEIEPKYCQVIIERYQKHCAAAGKEFSCRINGQPYNP